MSNGRPRDGQDVIVAEFTGVPEAEKAVRALELAGLEGGLISLEGPGAGRASRKRDTRPADRRLASRMGKRILLFSLVGAGAGAAAGFLLGATIGLSAAPTGAMIVAGALGIGAVAGLLGGYSGVPMGETSELAEQPTRGRTLVRVLAKGRQDVRLAEDVLRREGPVRVRRR